MRKKLIDFINSRIGDQGFEWQDAHDVFWKATDTGGQILRMNFENKNCSSFHALVGVRFDEIEDLANRPYFGLSDEVFRYQDTINDELGHLSAKKNLLSFRILDISEMETFLASFFRIFNNEGQRFYTQFSTMTQLFRHIKGQKLGYSASIKEPSYMARTVIALAYLLKDYKSVEKFITRYNEELPPLRKVCLSGPSLEHYHDFVQRMESKEDFVEWQREGKGKGGLLSSLKFWG